MTVKAQTEPTTAEGVFSRPLKKLNRVKAQQGELSPTSIVRDYLYADLALLAAPGGMGKTTLVLYELAHIALGRSLYGKSVDNPGPCVLITAEDGKRLCAARLARICEGLNLTDEESDKVFDSIEILDVSGIDFRLTDKDGAPTNIAQLIADRYRDANKRVITLDPLVSFVFAETNDHLHQAVTALRRVLRQLKCCLRLVHRIGQESARMILNDQYISRGGTALPDGCRMVHTLTYPKDKALSPAGIEREQSMVLCTSKLSYCPRQQPIWIQRQGFAYTYAIELAQTGEQRQRANDEQVCNLIKSELSAGRKHTRNTLEAMKPHNLSRNELRHAVNRLLQDNRISESPLPENQRHGRRKNYLKPAEVSCGLEESEPQTIGVESRR